MRGHSDRNDERRLRRCGGRGLQDAVYIIPNRIRHIRERIDGPAIKFIRAEVIGDREICHRLRTAVYDRNDIRNLIVCGVIFHHAVLVTVKASKSSPVTVLEFVVPPLYESVAKFVKMP